jgi:hypothetical protein
VMLAAFVVVDSSDLRWIIVGMASVALTWVGAAVISLYEKRQDTGFECLDRRQELIEISDCIQEEFLTEGNAQDMKKYYVTLIGILNCEYLDGESRWGSPAVPFYDSFNVAKANVLLSTIDDIADAVIIGEVVGDAVSLVADGVSDVLSSLAD